MRYFVICSILSFVICHWSFADTQYLRDVPEGHWAYEAVYDLIRRGVTGGYPDGTFRGKKLITRYEIASFLSKLARSLNVKRGMDEKLVEELKSELSLLQYQADKVQRETRVSSDFQARWRRGQTPNQSGGKTDYRMQAQVTRNFAEVASLKINLDTMDSGFNGGSRDFSRELLDIEAKVKVGAVNLKATSGPGDVTHIDDGLFPGENNVKYRRPKRTLSLSTGFGKTDFSLEYISRSTGASGLVSTAEISSRLSYDFSLLKFTLNPRYFYNSNGDRDVRIDFLGEFKPSKIFGSSILVGAAKAADYPHGLYVRGDLAFGEPNNCWEGIKIVAQKIGTQYREKFSYSIFDLFDRNLPDGSTNVGLELGKNLSRCWFVKAKGDFTNPGEVQTAELRLGYNVNINSTLELIYQTYRGTSFSQALGIGANFRF